MPVNLKGKSLLTLEEYSAVEIDHLIFQAIVLKELKRSRVFPKGLANRNFCLVFLKPSIRTRTSFVVAASDEGAHVETLDSKDIRFGLKESVKDIARVLGRMFDGIAFRGFDHCVVEELARYSGVPVWNGLTDDHHPTQVLADLMTIKERFGRVEGTRLAYVGDGRNNIANSLMIAASKMGIDLRIVAPAALQPTAQRVQQSQRAGSHPIARIMVTSDIVAGVKDCHAIYGDIWVSMGEEHLVHERIRQLKGYKITAETMVATGRDDAIYLHCQPALHDLETEFARQHPDVLEVSDELYEGPRSLVFEQAENRMHTIKALMVSTV